MADRRRLQGEIDKTLKKVNEGVDTFDDLWQKLLGLVSRTSSQEQTATNANQKDKYESELKKEIKKLQRLREQIKTWQSSNDIKDKKPLTEARKSIEQQMERFKVIERETKQKPYSKDALGGNTKFDPLHKEHEEIDNWLQSSINKLNSQIEDLEVRIDDLNANKKKRADREKVDITKKQIDNHKIYIDKLEFISELLIKKSLSYLKVQDIRTDIDDYVDLNDTQDFKENPYIFDELELETFERDKDTDDDDDDDDGEDDGGNNENDVINNGELEDNNEHNIVNDESLGEDDDDDASEDDDDDDDDDDDEEENNESDTENSDQVENENNKKTKLDEKNQNIISTAPPPTLATTTTLSNKQRKKKAGSEENEINHESPSLTNIKSSNSPSNITLNRSPIINRQQHQQRQQKQSTSSNNNREDDDTTTTNNNNNNINTQNDDKRRRHKSESGANGPTSETNSTPTKNKIDETKIKQQSATTKHQLKSTLNERNRTNSGNNSATKLSALNNKTAKYL
jgi:CCR4-NOT transcription complex subunit 3